jgi:uncharacterized protein YegP (UPF0339 family)
MPLEQGRADVCGQSTNSTFLVKTMAIFEVFKDVKKEYRWRLKASNGKIIADSGEGYVAKADCEHGIELVKKEAASAKIEDKSGKG